MHRPRRKSDRVRIRLESLPDPATDAQIELMEHEQLRRHVTKSQPMDLETWAAWLRSQASDRLHGYPPSLPCRAATEAEPGSEDKLVCMLERACAGQSLHHPHDRESRWTDDVCLRFVRDVFGDDAADEMLRTRDQ